MSAEEMAEAMYPESEMTYGYQSVREAFEYGYAAAQRVHLSVEEVAQTLIAHPWPSPFFKDICPTCMAEVKAGPNGPDHATHQARAVLALFAQQPTVAELCDEVERLRELAAAQNGRAGTAEAERDAALERLAAIHGWANQIAHHFGDEWPHTPACLGEAGCPLCMISEAASDPGEWLASRVVEVKAEALREAADDYGINLTVATGPQIRAWLRARADRIEREARS